MSPATDSSTVTKPAFVGSNPNGDNIVRDGRLGDAIYGKSSKIISSGTADSNAHNPPRKMIVTTALAHVVKDENLFVREVVKIGPDKFESELIVDGAHPYLYENAAIANHVSGTTFLDTSRQLLKAITHLFYAVPLANRFVIRSAHMDFTRWAKVRVPIRAVVDMTVRKKTILGHPCLTFTGELTWCQDRWPIGTLTGNFMTFSVEIEDQLMSRQYRQTPRAEPDMSV